MLYCMFSDAYTLSSAELILERIALLCKLVQFEEYKTSALLAAADLILRNCWFSIGGLVYRQGTSIVCSYCL